MPLNISIDVDGTLLDENDNLVPEARESLQRLRDAGHCLQLWSGGGADYAKKWAVKFQLEDLFDSYAKKPDLAIDDLPEKAHPLAVIHVDQQHKLENAALKVLGIEHNLDAALALNSKLINLVSQLQAEENSIRTQYGNILRPDIPLHPIPFFGVIDKARVITVGLNPSTTEFTEAGRWPQNPINTWELALRLVHYFRLPHTAPHHWFAELQWSLETLHCPYYLAAAHVDASPWTTYGPRYLAENVPDGLPLYNQLLDAGIQNWLPKTLEFCKDTVKLVIICPTSENRCQAESARLPVIKQKIRHTLGPEWNGKIVIQTKNQVPQWAWENRKDLVRLLDMEEVFP